MAVVLSLKGGAAVQKKAKRDYGRWLWVLPVIALVVCLFIYPLASQIFYSFTNKTLIKPSYAIKGLANYIAILEDPNFWSALVDIGEMDRMQFVFPDITWIYGGSGAE